MSFLKSIGSVVAVGVLMSFAGATSSFAVDGSENSTTRVSKKFNYGIFTFSLASDANTQISIADLARTDSGFEFKLSVEVKCNNHDTKIHYIFGEKKIDISETFCVATSDKNLLVSVNLNDAQGVGTIMLRTQDAITAALMGEPAQPGTGFNMDTKFAKAMETFCPGVQGDFVNNYTCMVFTDRKAEIAKTTAAVALDLYEQLN